MMVTHAAHFLKNSDSVQELYKGSPFSKTPTSWS